MCEVRIHHPLLSSVILTDEALSEIVASERLEINSSSSLCMVSAFSCIFLMSEDKLLPDSIYITFRFSVCNILEKTTAYFEDFESVVHPLLTVFQQCDHLSLTEESLNRVSILLDFEKCVDLFKCSGKSFSKI